MHNVSTGVMRREECFKPTGLFHISANALQPRTFKCYVIILFIVIVYLIYTLTRMKILVLLILLSGFYLWLPAQSAVSPATGDSLIVINNAATVNLMQKVEHERLADSLKQALLVEQINALKTNELKEKELIRQQLLKLQMADSVRNSLLTRQVDSLKKKASGAPVVVGGDTLCVLYTNIGSFTPSERAEHCANNIIKTARIYSVKYDSLTLTENSSSTDISFKDHILLSITDLDAQWLGTDRAKLAQQYGAAIHRTIGDYQKSISLLTILKQVGLCLLVILIQYLLIRLVNYFFRRVVDERIRKKKDEVFTGIRIKNFEVLNSDKQTKALLFGSKMVRYLVNIIQLYITLPILFSIFPVTQRLAETLFGWILTPVVALFSNFIGYLPKLFMIVVIVAIMRFIVKFMKYIATEVEQERLKIPGFFPDWAKATYNILRLFLYAFMLVMIFPLLPSSDTDIFKGVSVFIGIVFSLGSSSIIANMVAGMVITYMRPFKIGDRIKIGDLSGDVVEKSPFVTRIKTPKNEIITVPNANILSSSVVNYSSSASENGLILYTTVTIGYDAPWRQVHELLMKAAVRTEHVLADPAPFVLQTSLDDFYVSYQLCAYTKEAALQANTYSHLHQNIQDVFSEAQVEIMSPHYRANRNGDPSTIPPPPQRP